MRHYLHRVAIALSVLFNVLLGGHSNQTFSARNYEWHRQGRWNVVAFIDAVVWVATREEDHCSTSWAYWYVRRNVK
jgi:hypothetical protein